jgi:uncharacterized membrane protein SpoIIM required for sporulation
VIGHGAFELTAIALAGAAGLELGWALIAPRRLPRAEALRLAARKSVLAGLRGHAVPADCAFIEAYWSSMTAPVAHDQIPGWRRALVSWWRAYLLLRRTDPPCA